MDTMLNLQHRMHPDIAALIQEVFYDNRFDSNSRRAPVDQSAAVQPFRRLRRSTDLLVVNVSNSTAEPITNGRSQINRQHIIVAANLVKELLTNGVQR